MLYSPEEALRIGLVDECVPYERVQSRAMETAKEWSKIPSQARLASKMLVRGDRLHRMASMREQDVDDFVSFITKKEVQAALDGYLSMLAKRKA